MSYIDNDIKKVVFIEPLKENFRILQDRFDSIDDVVLINKGAGSEIKRLKMYKASNSLVSSSILKPKRHLTQHPDVIFDDGETIVEIDRIDNMLDDIVPYNFMNVDVQGYELEVFKGAGQFLGQVDYIMTEVNRDEVYESCPMIEDIDLYLEGFGFERLAVEWQSESWGDAIYVKR